ncbi:MAG: hypothetical protein DLM73_09700 [Chthoniobacterales bacterium]|nr:MAG: hypothetical protein DLM73_09700 [Chthoniobacterales bacterium]
MSPHLRHRGWTLVKAILHDPSNHRAHGGLSIRAIKSVPVSALKPLSAREAEVLGWIAAGKRNAEIGEIFGRSERTVEKHAQSIFKKLGVETRAGASCWWHERRRVIERELAVSGK